MGLRDLFRQSFGVTLAILVGPITLFGIAITDFTSGGLAVLEIAEAIGDMVFLGYYSNGEKKRTKQENYSQIGILIGPLSARVL